MVDRVSRGFAGAAEPVRDRIILCGGGCISSHDLDQLEVGALGELRDDIQQDRPLGSDHHPAERPELQAGVVIPGLGWFVEEKVRLTSQRNAA